MSISSSSNFAYDFDYLLGGNEDLCNVPKRFQNLRYGAKHVLLLSPNLDDDEMPLNWPEDKKMLVLFIFNAKEQMNQRSSNRRSNEVMSSVERVIVLHFVH